MSLPTSAYDLDPAQLADLLAELGQPAYRSGQVWRWLYRRCAADWSEMTDLPHSLRAELAERLSLQPLSLAARTDSEDGLATKFLFQLSDGQLIETVLMHYVDPADAEADPEPGELPAGRHTVCLSTQVGCAMGCVFCATGQMGLLRNLTRGECLAQLVYCARLLAAAGETLSNVVFMGMGEPLANWPATWGTVQTLTDAGGWALSPRRLTISTVGIVPGIARLAAEDLPVRLAVSLHAPDDALRQQLVPVNDVYPLDEILLACRAYQAATRRRITFEYVLIAGVNDRPDQATALARLLAGVKSHVNIIPVNPTAGSTLRTPDYATAVAFETALRSAGLATTLRMRRGIEIAAGCGQLRSREAEGRVGRALALAAQ
jgi:23S rRNA (adenine2503-C2)-methyltransferase